MLLGSHFFTDYSSENINCLSQMVTPAGVKLCMGRHFGARHRYCSSANIIP